MAEFLEVMKQKKRMCKKYTGGGICQSIDYKMCPLKGKDLCSQPIISINVDKIQEGEEIIMRWAAENPEIVYPSWEEWLVANGIMEPDNVCLNGGYRFYYNGKPVYNIPSPKMFDPIPADIAQKLSIAPKGV